MKDIKPLPNSGGDQLKQLRLAKNMTRYDLYRLSGVTTTQIRNIEKDISNPRPQTLASLVKALDANYNEVCEWFYYN